MGCFLPIITDFILLSYLFPDTLNYQDIVVGLFSFEIYFLQNSISHVVQHFVERFSLHRYSISYPSIFTANGVNSIDYKGYGV